MEVPDNGTSKLVNRIEGVMPGREPTLPQIGKAGGGGPVVTPPPGPGPGGHCPKVEPEPHGCACTVVGASQRGAGFAGLALASLLGLVLRRRARRVS